MPRLELDITDILMSRLQERAEKYALEPSDVAKAIISCELAKREKPCWMEHLTTIVSRVSDIVLAVSKTEPVNQEQ